MGNKISYRQYLQASKILKPQVGYAAILALIIMLGLTSEASSQGFTGNQNELPNHYTFVRVGEPSMDVVVMGTVMRPGNYRVREGTDLSMVFMHAGGASTIGERRRRKRPDVTLQISRKTDEGRQVVFTTDFESMLNKDVDYPILEPDDIIVVETVPLRPRFQWRDAASLISVASTTLLIIDRFVFSLSD